MREAGHSLANMDNGELAAWQKMTHKRGELLAVWDHVNGCEVLCLVIDDKSDMINPFGRKNKLRRVTIMIEGQVVKISPYEVFPIGEARETIPF